MQTPPISSGGSLRAQPGHLYLTTLPTALFHELQLVQTSVSSGSHRWAEASGASSVYTESSMSGEVRLELPLELEWLGKGVRIWPWRGEDLCCW